MRKLTWFSSGFAAVCLLCCYGAAGRLRLLLAGTAALALLSLAGRLIVQNAPARRRVFDVSRRVLALALGGLMACGWFTGWSALFRVPAQALAG